MNIKKRLFAFLTYILFPVTCLLFPVTCLADYDTTIATDGSEVRDTVTGLIWRRCPEPMLWSISSSSCTGTVSTYTHENALLRAKSVATSSGKAWRVPNVKELSSITKLGIAVNPSIDTTAFPATPSNGFWSSSPHVGDSSIAWVVNFVNGVVYYGYYGSRVNGNYVRLVR